MLRQRGPSMAQAWIFLGAAQSALRAGDRIAALMCLSCAARARRLALATLEVELVR